MRTKLILCCFTLITVFTYQGIAFGSPTSFDLDPVYLGAVGQDAPLKYYSVSVAVTADAIYSLDLFSKQVQKLDGTGTVINQFPTDARWSRGLDIDLDGNVYVADAEDGKIRRHDELGVITLEIGSKGSMPGQFQYLRAITVDSEGIIYAADKATQLSAFDSTGNLLWNNLGTVSADGILLGPHGMDRDAAGNIYVADSGRRQIVIFDADGEYVRAFGPWTFGSVVGVSVGTDGSIFVLMRYQLEAHIGLNQVYKFANNGDLISSWGAKGRGAGELWEPQGLTTGPDGDVWVAGFQGHNIVRYDANGNLVTEYNDHDIQPGEFASVRGVAVGENANIYVTDFWNQLVQVFDRYGQFVTMWGERGQGDGQYFNFPRFTAVNDLDQLYVNDDREVRLFDADGTFLARSDWIIFPSGMDIDNNGDVWVTELYEHNIRKYTSNLGLLQIFDGTTIPLGFNNPYGIVQGVNESLYITDSSNHRIVRMSTDGNFELEFGSFGTGPGEFLKPVGIAADSEGRIFVSETWKNRIQVFSPDGLYLADWNTPDHPGPDNAFVFEIDMDGDYFLYAADHRRGHAEVLKYALVPEPATVGQPIYAPGAQLGYFIWSDDGSTWHVRWSSDGVPHTFSGVISATVPINGSNSIGLEIDDVVQLTSTSRIDFSTQDSAGEDGVDILIGEAGVITFDLKIDDVENAGLVTVGGGTFKPNTLPLPLKTVSAPVIVDSDADSIADEYDNCTIVANPDQRDTNADGFGNVCDPDLDNNGIVNFIDIGLWVPFFNSTSGGDTDFNGDGLTNFEDFAIYPSYFLQPPGPSGVVR